MAYETTAQIINDVAVEIGVASQDSPDPFTDPDQNFVQLCRLLKSVGRKIHRLRYWSQFVQSSSQSLTTDEAYELPAGFDRVIDDTFWNETQAKRVLGPITIQTWAALLESGASVADQYVRVSGRSIIFLSSPNNGDLLVYWGVWRYWVGTDATSLGTADAPSASAQYVHLDPELVKAGLKLAFLRAKGLDSSGAEQDFADALFAAKNADALGTRLSVVPGSGVRLLDECNLPATGYGT